MPRSAAAVSKTNKANAKKGNRTEEASVPFLCAIGLELIEPIARDWIIRWSGGRVTGATPKGKVAGDFRAIVPPLGRSVLIECKHSPDKLSLSAFRPHQQAALDAHVAHGGISLVVWWNAVRVRILRWPIHALTKGAPIGDDYAADHCLLRHSDLRAQLKGFTTTPTTNNPNGGTNDQV